MFDIYDFLITYLSDNSTEFSLEWEIKCFIPFNFIDYLCQIGVT